MKLRYVLLLALLLGSVGGYMAEPYALPYLLTLLKPEQKPDEFDFDDTGADEPGEKVVEVVPDEPKKEEPTPPVVTPAPDDSDADGFADGQEDTDDSDAEGTTPKRLIAYEGEDSGILEVHEEAHVGKLLAANWRQPQMLERRLASGIRGRLKSGVSPKSVAGLLKDPEARLMLAQWGVLHRSDMKELANLMKDKDTCEDLSKLLNDLRWVTAFVYDGELERSEVALAMLRHLRVTDPNMDKDVVVDGEGSQTGMKRRVAAAVVVEFTRNYWYGDGREPTEEEIKRASYEGFAPSARRRGKRNAPTRDVFRLARERYQFFAEGLDKGLFNSGFEQLPDWLLHFVCGWKGDSPFGTASTMRWLRDNCSAPAESYTGMGSQVPYRPINVCADSIFSPYYYQPFNVLYPGNFAKETRDVGAVCGGVSHFGASSACANGIPAVTVGEPGHCAYAVYLDGKWVPCNSLFDKKSQHWKVWGSNAWSSLQMMTEMYKNGARTRDAQMVATLAAVLAEHKNPINALKLYEMSATMQPLNKPIWEQYIATATKSLNRQPRKWLGVNEFLCRSIAPQHPEMCANFLTQSIYPSMLATLRNPRQKLTAFEDLFKNFNVNEKAPWDIEKMLNMQYACLGKSRSVKTNYFRKLVDNVALHPAFGLAVTWALRTAYTENKNLGEAVLEMVLKAAETSPDKDMLMAAIIRAGEELSRPELVWKYSEPYMTKQDFSALEKPVRNDPLPTFERPGGNLMANGIPHLGMYNNDLRICLYHAAALTEQGGLIRSEAGKHQPLTVEFERPFRLGGLVIIPTGGAKSYRSWDVQVSADGKVWKHLASLPDSSDEAYVRVVVKRNNPTVRFIKVDCGEDQNVGINFRAFLIYDNKKAR